MNTTKKRTGIFAPDKLMAYSAVLVGLCALAVSIYEANIFRKQQKAAVWPYLELSYSNVGGFSYIITNKGVGPALIKWVIIKVDGEPIASWNEYKKRILDASGSNFSFISSFLNGRVISSKEKIKIISFDDPGAVALALKNIDRVSFEICYGSIFDDYWILKRDKSERKIYQVKDCRVDSKIVFQN